MVEANFDPTSSKLSTSLIKKNTKVANDESRRVCEEVEKVSAEVILEDRHIDA